MTHMLHAARCSNSAVKLLQYLEIHTPPRRALAAYGSFHHSKVKAEHLEALQPQETFALQLVAPLVRVVAVFGSTTEPH